MPSSAVWAGSGSPYFLRFFTAIASFGIGNTVQANAISTLADTSWGIPTWVSGAVICALTAIVILGGVKSIARVCSALVPFMALFYVVGCIYILCVNHDFLWPAVKLICEDATACRHRWSHRYGHHACGPLRNSPRPLL